MEDFFIPLFIDVLTTGLKSDKQVKIKGLGTFKVTAVSPRESVDVNTGERIIIEGRDKISFKCVIVGTKGNRDSAFWRTAQL